MSEPTSALLFYDGVCGLCNHFIRFVVRHDHLGRVRLAPLQSDLARAQLSRFGRTADDIDTVYLLLTFSDGYEVLLDRSNAMLKTLQLLGSPWSAAVILNLVPSAVRNWLYRRIAGNRYRWFGKYDSCPVAPPEVARRFAERSVPLKT